MKTSSTAGERGRDNGSASSSIVSLFEGEPLDDTGDPSSGSGASSGIYEEGPARGVEGPAERSLWGIAEGRGVDALGRGLTFDLGLGFALDFDFAEAGVPLRLVVGVEVEVDGVEGAEGLIKRGVVGAT